MVHIVLQAMRVPAVRGQLGPGPGLKCEKRLIQTQVRLVRGGGAVAGSWAGEAKSGQLRPGSARSSPSGSAGA